MQDHSFQQRYLCQGAVNDLISGPNTPMARLRTLQWWFRRLSMCAQKDWSAGNGTVVGKSHATDYAWERRVAQQVGQWSAPARMEQI
jgi:hypothetical protein